YFCEFEDLLLNDGCTGVAVIATDGPMELQFDEHKQLVCYAHDLKPFQAVLHDAGVPHVPDFQLISEGSHLHHSRPAYAREFRDLALRLGVGTDSVLSAECLSSAATARIAFLAAKSIQVLAATSITSRLNQCYV